MVIHVSTTRLHLLQQIRWLSNLDMDCFFLGIGQCLYFDLDSMPISIHYVDISSSDGALFLVVMFHLVLVLSLPIVIVSLLYRSIFDVNIDTLEEKPWRIPGVDVTDYFNFGFDENSWKQYCESLVSTFMCLEISLYDICLILVP